MSSSSFSRYDFASDTVAGICPEAWDCIAEANTASYASSYGSDEWSDRAEEMIRRLFGRPCSVFFITSGTAANAFSLSLLARPEDAIACHPFSHVEWDESNAPEFFTGGAKLLHAGGSLGKISAESLPKVLERGHGFHSSKVRVVSLTQATELGTVYTPGELEACLSIAKRYPGVKVHMDGARFANAVAALDLPAKDLVRDVDVLSLGGSKPGGGPCEAIACFDEALLVEKDHREQVLRRMKRAGHVTAKMRYLTASWIGLLENDVWIVNSRRANETAKKLAQGFEAIGYEVALPVETNQVFVNLPAPAAKSLEAKGWHFYFFDTVSAYRFVCSWRTTQEAVEELLSDLRKV